MSATEIVDDLARRGVELWVEGESLRFRAPQGAFPPELRQRLKAVKAEVLELLRNPAPGSCDVAPDDRRIEIAADPDQRFAPFSMTDLQQGYWVGQSDTIELGGLPAMGYSELVWPELDVPRLERALARVIAHHDMLRAVVLDDGRMRVLESAPAYRIEEIDLRSRPASEVEAEIERLRRTMAVRRVRSDAWPLFEIRVSRHDERVVVHWANCLLMIDDLSYHLVSDHLFRLYHQEDAALPTASIRFRDVVTALDKARAGAAYQRSLGFWRGRLDDLPPAPELPAARRPGANDRPRFRRFAARTSKASWEAFRRFAQGAGVTPASAMCAAYAEVLANWCRRPRFTLNMLFFNRPPWHPEIDQIVGNFTSTILLDVDGSGSTSLAERARALQKRLWRYQEHSRVSGVEVMRLMRRQAASGDAAQARMPIVFAANMGHGAGAAEPTEAAPGTGGTGSAEPIAKPQGTFGLLHTPQVLLDQQVHVLDGAMSFNWDAAASHLAEGVPEAMFEAYCELVSRLSEEAASWHECGRCLLPEAQRAVQAAANDTAADLASDGLLLHQPFAHRAVAQPDHPAVVAADRTLSYGELADRARSLGARLRAAGAKPETLVAVALPKGWRQVVAAVAVLESGAAFLPLDPGLPAERIRHLLMRGEVTLAVTDAAGLAGLDWPTAVTPIAVDEAPPEGVVPPLAPVQSPSDLAYVIFTSGSTGEPKGVMIEHRAAINTLRDLEARFNLGPGDRVFALSSLSFDLSVFDIFGMLGAGGTVVMPAPDELREPQRWLERLRDHGVTLWNTVPALMQMLADHTAEHGDRLPASLRLAMLSGDWIPLALPDRVRALGTELAVVSLGGATEASIWSILHPIETIDPRLPSIPYGTPMANQTIHLLDDGLAPRPIWVPGHLYIGGAGLARGYWRDADRTGAAFIVHPHTGERLYRTGDLGRYLPDGTIEFLGREDLQVKIQGYRVELGEIEAVLGEHPDVEGAWVVATGEPGMGKRLVAFVLGRSDQAPAEEALRNHLAAHLPAYMVPPSIRLLDRPPLTANGKIDRGALTASAASNSVRRAEPVAPRDDVEIRLVALWEELLDHRPVGVCDDFFALGGDSLLAVRLMAQIRRSLGRDLPLSALLGGGTVESLARAITERADSGSLAANPIVSLRADGDATPLVLVHPVGGNVLCYAPLAAALPASWPVHALERTSADHGGDALSLETLAARYVDALDAAHGFHGGVTPEAPYRLSGWSMGGVIAFEMARQLTDRGAVVATVAMIDPGPPGYDAKPTERDESDLLAWFAGDLSGLAEQAPDRPTADALRALPAADRLGRLHAWAAAAGVLPSDLEPTALARLFAVFSANARALERYRPGTFAGRVLLVETTAGNGSADAWTALAADGVEHRRLDADHFTIVQEPAVNAVACHLEAALS